MTKLFISALFAAVAFAQSPTVTSVTITDVSHSDMRVWFNSTGSWTEVNLRYAVSPATCTDGVSGSVQIVGAINPRSSNAAVLAGLQPNTIYQVCPQLSNDGGNTWSSGIGAMVTTLPLPAVHPAPPIPPATFNTSYPNTAGYNNVTVASDCHDFMSDINAAIQNQMSNGTVINIPAGTVCSGTYWITQNPPDVTHFASSAISTSNNAITLPNHGFSEGQGIVFATNYSCLPGSCTSGTYGPIITGQLYYAHVLDANTIQVYNGSPVSGGTLITFPDGGGGNNLMVVKWPRPLYWIVIRTATPDAQFAAPGTRVNPSWASKMPTIQLPLSHLGVNYAPNTALSFGDVDGNDQILTANLYLMGIQFNYQTNPYASTSSDPTPWWVLYATLPQNENIICDRCYFNAGGTPNRVERLIQWDGMNVALLNSYFENMDYFHSAYTGLAAAQTSSSSFTIGAGAHHFGAGSGSLANTANITFSGTNSGQNRAFAYFDFTGQFNVVLPTGLSGSCSGDSNCVVKSSSATGGGRYLPGASGYPNYASADTYFVEPIFSASANGSNPITLTGNSPVLPSSTRTDGPFELGTAFSSDTQGYIAGVRFYSVDTEPGRTVSLWDNSGNQLATAASPENVTNGWQTVLFSTPQSINAATPYVVSFHTTQFNTISNAYQNSGSDNAPLHVIPFYVPSPNNSCNYSDAWPRDPQARPAAGQVACIDIANGSIAAISNADATTSQFFTEGCQCMLGGVGPGPYMAINNYISGSGNVWHHDNSGFTWAQRGDYTYIRNTFHLSMARMLGGPQSDGMWYGHRQMLEWKSGKRINLTGNIFDGQFSDISNASIFIALSSQDWGITDVNMVSNTFKHGPGVTNPPQIVEPAPVNPSAPANRFNFSNNLAWDINGFVYHTPTWASQGGAGWVFEGPSGMEDMVVDHNTIVGNVGSNPSLIHLFDTKIEGVKVTNNILYLGFEEGLRQEGGERANACQNLFGKAQADCSLPGYVWDHNLMLSSSGQSAVQSWWPTLNNYIPKDMNLADVGWDSYNPSTGGGNFHLKANYCSGCANHASDLRNVGADINALESAQGKVTLNGPSRITSSSATITFDAPDSFGCAVDFSSTDSTLLNTFTRVNDTGTGTIRNVTLNGLASGTLYYYRVNCAVEQPTGQFRTN